MPILWRMLDTSWCHKGLPEGNRGRGYVPCNRGTFLTSLPLQTRILQARWHVSSGGRVRVTDDKASWSGNVPCPTTTAHHHR